MRALFLLRGAGRPVGVEARPSLMALGAVLLAACGTRRPDRRPSTSSGRSPTRGDSSTVRSPERPDERFYLFGVIHYDKTFDAGQAHLMIKPSAWHRVVAADRTFVEAVARAANPAPRLPGRRRSPVRIPACGRFPKTALTA